MKSLRYLLPILFLANTFSLSAQAPQVLSVFPANLSMVDQNNLEIEIEFDQALDLATVDVSTFKVFGRWTGPRTGLTFSMSDNDKKVSLLLDTDADPFNAGEWVTVALNKSIKGSNGMNMAKGYAWNFWINTKQGSLKQEKIQTIELRQDGETWLQSYGAYAGDLDNDSFSDLTVVNETSDDLRILLNDQTGNYQAATMEVYPMGQATPSPNEGADFNFDGDIDLAVCTAHDNELRVLFGDGEGSFYEMDTYITGTNARGLAVMDFNGDGAEDIVIANRGSNNMTLFSNNGAGVFTPNTVDFDLQGMGESGLVAVDANNDGIMDLFVGNYTSKDIAMLIGDGESGFVVKDKSSFSGADQPWMITTGDFDGDGFADVASANSNGNSVTIHYNDGNEGFLVQPLRLVHPSGSFPLAIDAGDIDGDGDLDLVSSNYNSVTFLVFENDGAGNFSIADVLTATKNASCAILHDRDNDGDLDITGTDEGDDRVFIFNNELLDSGLKSGSSIVNSLSISPNPFEDFLALDFYLPEAGRIKVEVVNVEGKRMSILQDKNLGEGQHQLTWDGKNEEGVEVSQGIYLIQISDGKKVYSEKVIRKLKKAPSQKNNIAAYSLN